jgi:hypothetical protein
MSRPQSDNVDVTLSEAVFDVRGPGFVAICIRRFEATYNVVAIKPDVHFWHKADNPTAPAFVRYWGNTGQVRASACQ